MKKSELKKRLVEALTPDEAAKVEPKYKETYAAMIKDKGPLKLKKYDNPDKVVRGRVVNTIKNESLKIAEKLGKKAKVGDYIEDFTDSDAPQFKGKSKKKKKQMAVAAFLNKEEQKLDEIDAMMEDAQEKSEKNYSNYFKKMDKNRLEEFVKAALMGPISEKETFTDKYDDNPGLKGKQKKLPDALQKGILGLEEYDSAPPNNNVFFKGKTKAGDNPAKRKLSDLDILPRHKRLENEMARTDYIATLKALGYDVEGIIDESFDSLSKKIDKQKGKSKKDAANIAGYIANIKRKGGGKGPTAKQKKRMAEYILKELRG